MSDVIRKDLGAVSAYAMAVQAGYRGTEAEFIQEQLGFAENARAVAEAKKATLTAQETAEKAKDDAENSAQEAKAAEEGAETARSDALVARNEAEQFAIRAEEKADIVSAVEKDFSNIANAIKGNASGAVISLDDVSPLEHTLAVKAQSKNIIPFPYYNESGYTDNGITYIYGADGVIYATGTSTEASRFHFAYSGNHKKPISPGTYTLSITGTGLDGTQTEAVAYVYDQSEVSLTGMLEAYYGKAPKVFTVPTDGTYRCFTYIPAGVTLDNAEIRVQIEKGATATEYVPYVDASNAKVLTSGKNLLDVNSGKYAPSPPTLGVETAEGELKITTNEDKADTWIRVEFCIGEMRKFIGKTLTFSARYQHSTGAFNPIIQFRGTDTLISGTETSADLLGGTSLEGKNLQATSGNGVFEWVAYINPTTVGVHKYLTVGIYLQNGGASTVGDWAKWSNIQVEYGNKATEYEPYTSAEYPVNADGMVDGVHSISPNMTITSDTDGVVLSAQYNKDSNKVIEKLINRIAALESAVI